MGQVDGNQALSTTAHCPDCGKSYLVTKKQQRAKKAQIFCGDCKKKFTVKEILPEKTAKTKKTKTEKPLPEAEKVSRKKIKPILLTEAETKYIFKEGSSTLSNLNGKQEGQPYLNNIGAVLRKSEVKTAVIVPQVSSSEGRLPWESETKPLNINWFFGVVIGVIILFLQTVYFEAPKASQHAKYRPLSEKLCRWVGCKLADYQNLSEFTVLQSSFVQQPDHTIVFKTAINNQASFRQRLPNIQMNLLGFNEQLIAQRIFYPKEYLTNARRAKLFIKPDETVEATLHIAASETPIGGYNFNLVY